MKLPRPFIRLPVRFDAASLRAEVEALPGAAWARHPADYPGNRSLRLISREGKANDDVGGPMLPTPELKACPHLRQVLESFGVVWSRSRLMELAPGAQVPEHADINLHWFRRVRLHIPIATHPDVRFHCGGETVHMAEGEAWLFDNWRLHRVENRSDHRRVHLVADTSGSASFWNWALASHAEDRVFAFDPAREAIVTTERMPEPAVLPPGEVDLIVQDFLGELAPAEGADEPAAIEALSLAVQHFALDWRQLWTVHGDSSAGRGHYRAVREILRKRAQAHAPGLVMRSNRIPALKVLEARLLQHAIADEEGGPRSLVESKASGRRMPTLGLERPLILLAAPRSGSTWLFEMLSASPELWNLGGEAHWLFEALPALRPGAPGIESNRLDARAMTDERIADIRRRLIETGSPVPGLRLLEKTPKNALRVPALERLFPDARYVLLWRDPRESLASIVEAWNSGRFVTYPALEGWDGPWSLLLPPGWRSLRGAGLARIAAFQWESANRIALDDLDGLAAERWMSLGYAELCADPAAAMKRICDFAGLDFDRGVTAAVARRQAWSRYTLSPPRARKWLVHEAAIVDVLPQVTKTWRRLQV